MTGEFAGALRERIAIERRAGTRDLRAGATGRYEYDGCAWAAITPVMPSVLVAGDALSALPRWRVTMRKREAIGPWTRLVWRGKFLIVRSVESDPRDPARMMMITDEVR